MTTATYVEKSEVLAVLRSRELHGRADWVDRELPAFIDTLKNAALLRTLEIDLAAVPLGPCPSASLCMERPPGDSSDSTDAEGEVAGR
jgi:hypothetical protein